MKKYYAPTSWKTRQSAWNKYLRFCASMELSAIPATPLTIARYIAYLGSSCELKFSTITNYVSAVSILHKFHGIQCLAIESFLVKAVLKGYRRMLGHTMVQKLPITPDMLKRIISICDKKNESGFIAAILVGFFTFLRKSKLSARKYGKFQTRSSPEPGFICL